MSFTDFATNFATGSHRETQGKDATTNDSMSEISDIPVQIVSNFESLPKKPKVMVWHWIGYWLFNIYRKPLVWKKQKELIKILNQVKEALEIEVYPLTRRSSCPECHDGYLALRPQVFLSQIELIVRRMGCDFHPDIFNAFITKHVHQFKKSEEIARWINNL